MSDREHSIDNSASTEHQTDRICWHYSHVQSIRVLILHAEAQMVNVVSISATWLASQIEVGSEAICLVYNV